MSAGRHIRRRFAGVVVVVAIAAAALATGPAGAHKGATGIVMERMELMKSLQRVMKDLGDMVKGKRPLDAAQVKAHAAAIKRHAVQLPKMFPKGSNPHPSEALPSVWTDWETFVARSGAMGDAADKLAAAASGSRKDVLKAFIGVARSCTGCHTGFRKRK